jgi:hypothetical protein
MFLSIALESKAVRTYILPGQHDMQFHSLETLDKTSYGILNTIAKRKSTQLRLMQEVGMAAPFGVETFSGIENGFYFTHVLCFPNNKSIHGSMSGLTARELLNKHQKVKIICVGDNHHGFVFEDKEENRIVAAPGCLTRQSYDMDGYIPGVLLYSENKKCAMVDIQNYHDTADLVQDSYMEKKELKDESVGAFVESLKGVSQKKFTLSFLDNLIKAIEEDTLDDDCADFIQEMIDTVKK